MQAIPIEGVTPTALWNAAYVFLAILGIVIILDKVNDIVAKHKKRKRDLQQEQQAPVENLDGRLQKIEKRLDSIDDKLSSDKRRLEALERQQDDADAGFRALCKATLAMLNHELHNGNTDEMEAAQKILTDYLIGK